MTRVEFEQKLKSFITKALEKGYGIDYVAIIKKDAEELYAACAKGVIPESEVVSYLSTDVFLFEESPIEEYAPEDLEMVELCWKYLEFYPEDDEENCGGISGIRPDAPESAKKVYADYVKRKRAHIRF